MQEKITRILSRPDIDTILDRFELNPVGNTRELCEIVGRGASLTPGRPACVTFPNGILNTGLWPGKRTSDRDLFTGSCSKFRPGPKDVICTNR